jgi:predicted nucleotidyltransferase
MARVQTKDQVLAGLREHRTRIRALGVKRLGLFGFFARSEQTAPSDIDLLVEFEEGQKTFDHFIELAFFLEERRILSGP